VKRLKVCSSKSKFTVLNKKKVQRSLWGGDESLPKVEDE